MDMGWYGVDIVVDIGIYAIVSSIVEGCKENS